MARAVQQRTLETRARLIRAAEEIVAEEGFGALRVEEVARRAGTAKGTFFAHFRDKDALMERIVGARIDACLDALEAGETPVSAEAMVDALMPLCAFMMCERYVFDLILRYSGAAAIEEIGPIAATFDRQIDIFQRWFEAAPFRRDVPADLLAEGVQAFTIQATAMHFCALHTTQSTRARLAAYLKAWLSPEKKKL